MKGAIKMQNMIIYFVCVPCSYGVYNNVTLTNFRCTLLNLLAQALNEILIDMTLKQHCVLEHKRKGVGFFLLAHLHESWNILLAVFVNIKISKACFNRKRKALFFWFLLASVFNLLWFWNQTLKGILSLIHYIWDWRAVQAEAESNVLDFFFKWDLLTLHSRNNNQMIWCLTNL